MVGMAASEKKRKSNRRYLEKCDLITLKPRIERGRLIRLAASESGQSLQGYILEATEQRMEREGKPVWSAGDAPGER